jgi:hypothetical protein
VVLEIVAGIVVGPSLLGLAEVDTSLEVVALLGLAFVLFLAGLEIEFEKLRGPLLRLTGLGFALSFAIAVVVSFGLQAGGLVDSPLLVAIILCATSLPFIVAATAIGRELDLIDAAASAALIGAGLLSSPARAGRYTPGVCSRWRAWKNAAIEAAAVATTEIAHSSRKTSSTRPAGVTGLGIWELTVVSCAETQNSAPPIVWKPVPRASCSNRYISTVATTSSVRVDARRNASRERRNWCVRDSPRITIPSSDFMWPMPGSAMT